MKKAEITKSNSEEVSSETLKQYLQAANLVAHLNNTEVDQFIQIAQAFGLNPFKREIYASKYGNNFSIVVGYETYIKRAERSGLLSGWKQETEGEVNFQKPRESTLKAIITIHRKDFDFPFVHEVYFSEYCQFNREGQMTKFWKDKPITMIKKVAISQGFRLCFSDELGGIPYTKEEIGDEEASYTIVESSKPAETVTKKIEKPIEKAVQKTPAEAFEGLKEKIKEEIKKTLTREELKKLFNSYPGFKTLPEFLDLVKTRTKEIDLEAEIEEAEEAEIEEVEVLEEPSEESLPLFPSENYDAAESIKFLKIIIDKDQILDFIMNENRKTVLDAANKRIEKLA